MVKKNLNLNLKKKNTNVAKKENTHMIYIRKVYIRELELKFRIFSTQKKKLGTNSW